jgi:hypothetical protein
MKKKAGSPGGGRGGRGLGADASSGCPAPQAACGGTTATSDRETCSSVKRKSMKVLQNEAIEKELNYARQIKLERADTRRKRKLWEA